MSDTTLFIRDPQVWKNGIVPDEFMTEQESIKRAEEIAIKQILEDEATEAERQENFCN